MQCSPKSPERPEDCATAWFAALERARLTGDARLERIARDNLRRLGVSVDFASADSAARKGVGNE